MEVVFEEDSGDKSLASSRIFERHYRVGPQTIAVTMVPAVEGILTEFLFGHAAKSIPRKYASAVFVTKSRALREAQRQIGTRIIDLLGLKDADYV